MDYKDYDILIAKIASDLIAKEEIVLVNFNYSKDYCKTLLKIIELLSNLGIVMNLSIQCTLIDYFRIKHNFKQLKFKWINVLAEIDGIDCTNVYDVNTLNEIYKEYYKEKK